MRLNVLLVGEESAGIRVLRAIAKSEHQIVGVMAREHAATSRGASVWQAAKQLGCETWPAKWVCDPGFAETVRSEAVDLILNVHSLDIVARQVEKILEIHRIVKENGDLEYARKERENTRTEAERELVDMLTPEQMDKLRELDPNGFGKRHPRGF